MNVLISCEVLTVGGVFCWSLPLMQLLHLLCTVGRRYHVHSAVDAAFSHVMMEIVRQQRDNYVRRGYQLSHRFWTVHDVQQHWFHLGVFSSHQIGLVLQHRRYGET